MKVFKTLNLLTIAVLLLVVSGVALANDITFVTTQFTPIEEQEYVRREILRAFTDETGLGVAMINEEDAALHNRLQAEARAGRFNSDVFGALHGDFPPLAANGVPMDLGSVDHLEGRNFIQEFVRLGNIDGEQLYVPWAQATYIMMANKKALEYLPEGADINTLTYDQLLAWAKNMYEETGSAKLGFPAGPRGLFGRMIHGYLYPAFTGHQVQNFNSPEAVAMWEYLAELFEYAHASSAVYESMSDPLLLEEVWVAWDHTARLGAAVRENPDQYVAFPSPAGPKGRAFITVITGLGIPQGASDVDKSWKLIEYFTRPDVQVKVLQGTGFFPTTLEASGHVPEGPERVLAEAVTTQANSSDAILSLLPVGLGDRTGEFVPMYTDAFQAIVYQNQDIETVLERQGRRLEGLFENTGAPYPQP